MHGIECRIFVRILVYVELVYSELIVIQVLAFYILLMLGLLPINYFLPEIEAVYWRLRNLPKMLKITKKEENLRISKVFCE